MYDRSWYQVQEKLIAAEMLLAINSKLTRLLNRRNKKPPSKRKAVK